MLPTETIECPYCGEAIDLVIDDSADHQRYIEDCAVCCRPIEVEVSKDASSEIRVTCHTDSDS